MVFFLGVVTLAAIVVASLPDEPDVTRRNFRRISDDMTRKDVEHVFGQPPKETFGQGRHMCIWLHENGAVRIIFDEDGRIVQKRWRDFSFWGTVYELIPIF